jgi:hypothetical protein
MIKKLAAWYVAIGVRVMIASSRPNNNYLASPQHNPKSAT